MDKFNLIGYLAIIIIVISLLNIGVELTGRATDSPDTAVVNVTIETTTSINFTTDFLDFGSGRVTYGQSSADLQSNNSGSPTNGNWTQPGDSFTLENVGNQNVSLDLKTGKTAAIFLGGTSPAYYYAYADLSGESGSCANQTAQGKWEVVNTAGSGDTICNPLYARDANDAIDIDVKLTVPSDSQSGELTDTFTATATAV